MIYHFDVEMEKKYHGSWCIDSHTVDYVWLTGLVFQGDGFPVHCTIPITRHDRKFNGVLYFTEIVSEREELTSDFNSAQRYNVTSFLDRILSNILERYTA